MACTDCNIYNIYKVLDEYIVLYTCHDPQLYRYLGPIWIAVYTAMTTAVAKGVAKDLLYLNAWWRGHLAVAGNSDTNSTHKTKIRSKKCVQCHRPVCFVFERARTPRHFLLGKGHRLGYCKILLLAFQGHQGNDQGHGGKRLCCLHVVYSRCLKNVCKYCLLHDPSITTHCRMQKVPCSTMHVDQLCPPFWESILFCTFIVPNWRTS